MFFLYLCRGNQENNLSNENDPELCPYTVWHSWNISSVAASVGMVGQKPIHQSSPPAGMILSQVAVSFFQFIFHKAKQKQ